VFQSELKILDLAQHGGAEFNLAGRQAIEHGIGMGTGSIWLKLTGEQYDTLRRELGQMVFRIVSLLCLCAEVTGKQLPRPLLALFAKQHRLCLVPWIIDVAALMQPGQHIPIMTLPRTVIVMKRKPQ
jgi:hypothetical protein